jgi:glucokinase
MTKLIGIDVGGTNLRIGVVAYTSDDHPHLIEEIRFQADFSKLCKTYFDDPEVAWKNIVRSVSEAIETARAKHPDISAIGIGFPGFIEPVTQRVSQSPNLPGLENVDLSADLSALVKLPVITENDALAAAYGEYVMHPVKTGNLIYLGLGTGVGGGLILNGKPFQGQHGVAMEVGHIIVQPDGRLCGCGNLGCMEQYASACGVSISYFEATKQQYNAAEIAALASAGDRDAIIAYQLAGVSLAKALAHILKVIDVTDVVIGGGMSAGWVYMESAFHRQLENDLIQVLRGKVNVRISNIGDQAGMLGAAMLAI